jgi:predicted porin
MKGRSMKKSLFALALCSGFAGAVCAQTNVTIYGIVDMGLVRENNGSASSTRLDSGLLNGSRLGFKGSEDLGGGLSAIFQLENGFSADTGALGQGGLLFGRQAYVGLAGGFGTVKFGRQVSLLFANSGTFDPFVDALAGDTARLFTGYYGSRSDNTISYGYDANGFRGELDYSLGEVSGSTQAGRKIAGYVGYQKNAFDAILTYQRNNNTTGDDSARTVMIGGNYNFGPLKAFLTYAWNKGVGTVDTRDALVGVRVPITPAGTFIASYIKKTDKFTTNAGANQIAIGYTHALSKRTTLYTSYGQLKNDAGASYQVAAPGNTDKLFNVGIRHSF